MAVARTRRQIAVHYVRIFFLRFVFELKLMFVFVFVCSVYGRGCDLRMCSTSWRFRCRFGVRKRFVVIVVRLLTLKSNTFFLSGRELPEGSKPITGLAESLRTSTRLFVRFVSVSFTFLISRFARSWFRF